MDELIRDLYGEPATDPGARERVRARLEQERVRPAAAHRARPPYPARRRLVGGLLLAGAAAALAVAHPALTRAPESRPGQAVTVSGESILLAAATRAESSTAGGAFWHVRRQSAGRVTELWAARDGRAWSGADGALSPTDRPFSLAGRPMSLAEIQELPDDPGRLLQAVTALLPSLPEGARDGVVADALSGLLWSKPAPSGVRAAAYRALAGLGNVRYLGGTVDSLGRPGVGFAYDLRWPRASHRQLIIDPGDGQVLASVTDGGSELVLEAGWTDRGPRP
ncbi:CU044_5270 family protein [Nonomuraea sp. NPDC050663]|uniref:CU044_5270 family protein n=1 Tax=Nonomuraea sp. NPDC050663 TaxID=3364370 RepID=UPI0037A35F00